MSARYVCVKLEQIGKGASVFDRGRLQFAADSSGRDRLLRALLAFSREDFSVRLPVSLEGLDDEVAAAFNAAAATNEQQAKLAQRQIEQTDRIELEIAELSRARLEMAHKSEELACHARSTEAQLVELSFKQRSLLNSMLILAKLLADNAGNTLVPKQVDYAQTIYSAGTQLLSLIDDVRALAHAENKTVPERDAAAPPQGDRREFGSILSSIAGSESPVTGNAGDGPASLLRGQDVRAYRGPRSRCSDDGSVLIAEADVHSAAAMLAMVRNIGYQGTVAADLDQLHALIGKRQPYAILLGTSFAGGDGWSAFDLLKRDPATWQLPVSIDCQRGHFHTRLQDDAGGLGENDPLACGDEALPRRILAGLRAAAGRDIRRLLVVEDAANHRPASVDYWHYVDIETEIAVSGALGLAALHGRDFDAIVVGSVLPDMAPGELMRAIMAMDLPGDLPVAMVGLAGDACNETVDIGICKHRKTYADALAETSLFLHKVIGEHPYAEREHPFDGQRGLPALHGRKALLVDDNILDIYALTGVLEQQGMIVLHAENRAEALEVLRAHADTHVVVLAAGTTSMDSRELIGSVRSMAAFAALPIIAVTAGTAPGNREACVAIGASDYIDKPVNVEQLLALLRAWLGGLRQDAASGG